MTTAYLTIDDVPTQHNPKIIDFIVSLNIKPLMFCWGEKLENCRKEAIYALKKGAILQNHSYSHPHFSELSFDQAKNEILRNEKLLESIYTEAGIKRPYKLFRFPYGDQGEANKEKLQHFLREQGFARIDDRAFDNTTYIQNGKKEDMDVYWTFDYGEYNIRPGNAFTFDDVIERVNGFLGSPSVQPVESGKAPEGAVSKNIILIHDHDETEECCPGYFEKQIKLVLERGVCFVDPAVLN